MAKRVVVGLSGGVDSSVAAYLLKKQGYDVIGIFMKNWHDDSVTISDDCPWLDDANDAMIVAEKLGIPFQTIDFSKQYKKQIVDYMFEEYKQGRTPNPDVLCNREIKFSVFLDTALKLKADFVATGHYCRKGVIEKEEEKIYQLLAGKDDNKDQSYFLCQLSQGQLAKSLFPIGELTKPEVREIAKAQELITAEKRDSQGLCFIGKVRLPDFLQQQLKPKTGKVIEIPTSFTGFNSEPSQITHPLNHEELKLISAPYLYKKEDGIIKGEHSGAHYFTVGQRKGLAIGGTPLPMFVLDTDVKENIIYTGQGENHPGLLRSGLFVQNDEVHWVRPDLKLVARETARYKARIRYRQPLDCATLYQEEDGLYIIFDVPQKAIAKGQFVAWYDKDELVGSGVIG
ncbi:MAG: tRNA 2-thiouridine(34) synthase MnmA [Cyclobacteriaceae bacterium]|nr:tRNA 2-thiouridine(34) synthase MnmA [Cyclobacteriaceae bacterium]